MITRERVCGDGQPSERPELNGWREVPCPTCGATVIWAEITKADGKPGRVPLDPRPPIWVVTKDGQGKRVPQKRTDERRVLVSHFTTCKNPPTRPR